MNDAVDEVVIDVDKAFNVYATHVDTYAVVVVDVVADVVDVACYYVADVVVGVAVDGDAWLLMILLLTM